MTHVGAMREFGEGAREPCGMGGAQEGGRCRRGGQGCILLALPRGLVFREGVLGVRVSIWENVTLAGVLGLGGGTRRGPPLDPGYLAVHTHPAAVKGMLAEARGAAQLVLARRGVDDLQGRVTHRPVDAEVGCLPGLPRFCIADAWAGDGPVTRGAAPGRGARDPGIIPGGPLLAHSAPGACSHLLCVWALGSLNTHLLGKVPGS